MAAESRPPSGTPGRGDPDQTRVVRPLTLFNQVKHLLPRLAEPQPEEVVRLAQESLRQRRGETR
jgi:hypothetical protein